MSQQDEKQFETSLAIKEMIRGEGWQEISRELLGETAGLKDELLDLNENAVRDINDGTLTLEIIGAKVLTINARIDAINFIFNLVKGIKHKGDKAASRLT